MIVMPGLDPGIQVVSLHKGSMDCRVEPGNDEDG